MLPSPRYSFHGQCSLCELATDWIDMTSYTDVDSVNAQQFSATAVKVHMLFAFLLNHMSQLFYCTFF